MLLDLSNYQHQDDQGKTTIPYKNFQPISSTRTLLSEIVKKVNLFYKKVANSYDKASFALCSKTVGRFVQSVTALLMAATMCVLLSVCVDQWEKSTVCSDQSNRGPKNYDEEEMWTFGNGRHRRGRCKNKTMVKSVQLGKLLALTILRIYAL